MRKSSKKRRETNLKIWILIVLKEILSRRSSFVRTTARNRAPAEDEAEQQSCSQQEPKEQGGRSSTVRGGALVHKVIEAEIVNAGGTRLRSAAPVAACCDARSARDLIAAK